MKLQTISLNIMSYTKNFFKHITKIFRIQKSYKISKYTHTHTPHTHIHRDTHTHIHAHTNTHTTNTHTHIHAGLYAFLFN